MFAVMWGLYVEYSRSAVGNLCAMWQTFYSGGYANTVNEIAIILFTLWTAVTSCEVYILT